MLQAIVKKRKAFPVEVPAPTVSKGSVLIRVVNSCISAGTELSVMHVSGSGLVKRALQQPEKLKRIVDFARSNGVAKTLRRVHDTIEEEVPIGYSVAGVVIAAGEGVQGFSTGDRVAAAGSGMANHAEIVDVPVNLVVRIPDGTGFIEASTVALGSIAMQGVRRCDLRLGEYCVVYGTGILGLIAVQLLKRSGVRVIALDVDEYRLKIAGDLGAEACIDPSETDPVGAVHSLTGGRGADAVLFAASTPSSKPLSLSFNMCKKKGRVVLLGVTGMEMRREDMYEKELDFLISTSYGPGRYDHQYEQKGLEYPYGYVRWTENRNMAEYLRLLAAREIRLENLISGIYPIAEVGKAFEDLSDKSKNVLLAVLDCGWDANQPNFSRSSHTVHIKPRPADKSKIGVALIGAGNFATGVHLPNISRLNNRYDLRAVMGRGGHKAKVAADRCGAAYATTDLQQILDDREIDLVMIATRHENHAELALAALEAGKHVFVEKPLAVDEVGLSRIADFFAGNKDNQVPLLTVGFNRRFSPYVRLIKKHTDQRVNPLFVHYRINAGFVPLDHWVHDAGGRIIGEACHIIDLMTCLTGCVVESMSAESLKPKTDKFSSADNKSIQLRYQDGSIATIEYFAVGNSSFPKEYMEVHFDSKTIALDDFRSLKFYGIEQREMKTRASEKGHFEELVELAEAVRTGKWPIELWDLFQTTNLAIQLA